MSRQILDEADKVLTHAGALDQARTIRELRAVAEEIVLSFDRWKVYNVSIPFAVATRIDKLRRFVDEPAKVDYCHVGCTGPHHRPECALGGQVRDMT